MINVLYITELIRYKATAEGMSLSPMKQITSYIEPKEYPKVAKRRGSLGFKTDSAYIRFLIGKDLGLITERN